MRKINIDTDLRLASTGAIRRFVAENPADFDPRGYLKATITAMRSICSSRYVSFGAAGWAHSIRALSLEAMTLAILISAIKPVALCTMTQPGVSVSDDARPDNSIFVPLDRETG